MVEYRNKSTKNAIESLDYKNTVKITDQLKPVIDMYSQWDLCVSNKKPLPKLHSNPHNGHALSGFYSTTWKQFY